MASLRRRGDAISVLFRLDKTQTSETFRGPNREKEAAKFLRLIERVGAEAAVEARGARRENGNDDVPIVTEWVLHHIDHLSGVTQGTISDYRSYVRLSLEGTLLGSLPVDVVTRDHVIRWINDLAAKGLSGKTIRNRHSLLAHAFRRAITDKLRTDNPAKSVTIPKTVTEEMVFLTHGEFAILYSHVPRHWQPLVATLAATGLRFGEATALQVRDVHLNDNPPTVTINRAWKHTDSKARELGPPKTKAGRRTISLPENVVSLLRPLVNTRQHDAFVFTTVRGKPVRHSEFLASVWQIAVARATMTTDERGNEIPADRRITKRPRLHDIRHSYASWMLAGGMNLMDLQYRLGHTESRTTIDRYGHLMPGHQDRAAALAEIALAQALPELEPSLFPALPELHAETGDI